MTFTILSLLLSFHLSQFLIVPLGALLQRKFFPTCAWSFQARVLSVYGIGVLALALLGILLWILKLPIWLVWIIFLLITLLLVRSLHVTLHAVWEGYVRLCLVPFIILAGYALFLVSHFTPEELEPHMEPWALADRVSTYHVPDHILQWQISENLKNKVQLENGFRRRKASIWSAGDRPLLVGFLDATLGALTGARTIDLYFLRIIFWSSLLLFALSGLFKDDFKIVGWRNVLILSLVWLQPFFLSNALYTWPKSAGLAFGVSAIYFLFAALQDSKENGKTQKLCLSGITAAIAVLCHSAAVYCLAAAVPLYLMKYGKPKLPSFKNCLIATALFFVPLALHEWYLSAHTRPTQLLPRVQLCRNGSYAHPTPVVSLTEACRDYLEKEGWQGVIGHRVESFRRAFFEGYAEFVQQLQNFSSETFLGWWYKKTLAQPAITYGLLSMPILIILIIVGFFKWQEVRTPLVFGVTGLLLLICFCCSLGEFTEMSSHVVPYIIPLCLSLCVVLAFLQLGVVGSVLLGFFFVLNCALLLPRAEFSQQPLLGLIGLVFVLFGSYIQNLIDASCD